MLARRIIPVLLHRGHTLVKGQKFDSWRSVGHVLQAARIHAARQVDELCVLNIGATPEGRGPDLDLVAQICDGNFCPVTVGGGVRSVEDVDALLRAGADKVSICTAAVRTSEYDLLASCADRFGRQAIVAAIDYKRPPPAPEIEGGMLMRWDPMIRIQCGMQCVMVGPVDAARDYVARGAGEILLTSIDREGTLQGYDLDLIRAVAGAVDIPVIANGGCGSYADMAAALDAGASAVAAGAFFAFTDATPKGAAQLLHENGYEVRL